MSEADFLKRKRIIDGIYEQHATRESACMAAYNYLLLAKEHAWHQTFLYIWRSRNKAFRIGRIKPRAKNYTIHYSNFSGLFGWTS